MCSEKLVCAPLPSLPEVCPMLHLKQFQCVSLIDNGQTSSFPGGSSTAALFLTSLLQAIDGIGNGEMFWS